MISRRTLVVPLACLAAADTLPGPAVAQQPHRTLLVGFPPGGGMDALARLLAEQARARLNWNIVIDNRAGAIGMISAGTAKNAPPDGSVFLLGNSATMMLAPLGLANPKYDALTDFETIVGFCDFPFGLVASPKTGATDLASLLAYLRDHPSERSYGTPGAGSFSHIAGILLGRAVKMNFTHVAYRGGAPLMNDMAGGHIPFGITTAGDVVGQHVAKVLRIVSVTGTKRSEALPDVPTFAEQGIPGLETNGWIAFFLPAKTPSSVVGEFRDMFSALSRDEVVRKRLVELSFDLNILDSAALRQRIVRERDLFRPIVATL